MDPYFLVLNVLVKFQLFTISWSAKYTWGRKIFVTFDK